MTAIFHGQTSIIQLVIGVFENFKYIDLIVDLWTSLPVDKIEIERFIISIVGDNFPCVGLKPKIVMKYG